MDFSCIKFLPSSPHYSVYITWMYLVVMYIVPFTCLAAFNLRIYLQIRSGFQWHADDLMFEFKTYPNCQKVAKK